MKPGQQSTRAAALAAIGLLALLPLAAPAQAIYRLVSPDGRVTFADKPPAADARTSSMPAREAAAAEAAANQASLPYELRQLAQRYPVTLYTTDGCAPCQSARALLLGRGIPFSERTVNTPQDGEALKKLSNDMALPVLTIGAQQLRGFAEAEWQQYLTAAGYPPQSQLPAGYRLAPPQPLVDSPRPATPLPAPIDNTPPLPSPGGPGGPANPAGIVF